MSKAVAPAIEYAKNGYAVSEIISGQWKAAEKQAGGRSGDAPPRSCRAATRRSPARCSRIPNLAATLQTDRRRRTRRVLQRADRAGDRRRHEASATGCSRSATSPSTRADWVAADLDQLPRLRRLRDAAEHAGLRRARDAEHPRGVRPQVDGPQLRRSICTCWSKRSASRSPIAPPISAIRTSVPRRRAADADLEGVRGAAPARRSIRRVRRRTYKPGAIKGVSSSAGAEAIRTSPAAISATRST